MSGDTAGSFDENGAVADTFNDNGALRPAEPALFLMPLAMQGPAAVAWKLVTDANSTKEQKDAVALYALSLQKRCDERPDQTTILLPAATPANNHRALCLGAARRY